MMGKNHMLFGAAAGALASAALTGEMAFGAVAAGLLGGLTPDLDHPESKIGRVLPFLSIPLNMIAGHRDGTHSLGFVLLMTLLAAPFGLAAAVGMAAGALAHLACDAISFSRGVRFTVGGGVPALWPSKRRYGFRLLVVGGVGEYLLVWPLAFVTLAFASGISV